MQFYFKSMTENNVWDLRSENKVDWLDIKSLKMAKICIPEGKEGMWVGKIRNLVPKRREHHSFLFFRRVGRSSGQCYEKTKDRLLFFFIPSVSL